MEHRALRLLCVLVLIGGATDLAFARQGGGIATPNFGSGAFDYVEGGSNRFWSYEGGLDWWTVRFLPGTVGVGGAIASRFNACTYGLVGNGTSIFYRAGSSCGFATGNVERLADAPFVPGRGASLASLPGYVGVPEDYVFALRGGATAELWRYEIPLQAWSRLADVPALVDDAGAMDLVYAWDEVTARYEWQLAVFTTSGTSTLYFYSIGRDSWSAMSVPFVLGPGASVAATWGGTTIEVLVGGGREYWVYDPWASGWTRRADTPGMVTVGADMSFSGAGNSLDTWVHPGDGSIEAWAYSPSTGSWRVAAVLPTDNTPPVAVAKGPATLEGCPACVVQVPLDASASYDPDGDRLRFEWREGTRFLSPFNATLTGVGPHVITLTVRDHRGGVATDTLEVTVLDPADGLRQQVADLLVLLAECETGGVALSEVAQQLESLESALAAEFDVGFVLDGATAEARVATLVRAVLAMNRGARLQLLRSLQGRD